MKKISIIILLSIISIVVLAQQSNHSRGITKGENQVESFLNSVRAIEAASYPDDQKLLQYRKIMPFASSDEERTAVINQIAKLKTFLSMVYLEPFLADDNLKQSASLAILKIALANESSSDRFYGDKVRQLLETSKVVLSNDKNEDYTNEINTYLAHMPKGKGLTPMFNGKNLDGWKGLVENPIARSKMSKSELAEKQKVADEKMLKNWKAQDNMIVFSGKGANLCSEKDYGDFEMFVDWMITEEGDGGIYLRGTPQVQIWDTSRVEVGAQVGSGGLYNNDKHESIPLKVADNPVNEWNTFHITMIGDKVTVYLNGELVVDHITMDNYWDRTQAIFTTGAIELQAHGTQLFFRDIYIREINTPAVGLTEEEKAEGFVSLFNGENLEGWQGNKTDYFAENGLLIIDPKNGGHGNLFTEKEYTDFIFRFEFQLTPAANNGLGIRAPLEGDAAYKGMELQILDNSAPVYAELKDYQYHGSVYGVIPAKRGFQKAVGEWNTQEVIVKGSKIKVILNGEVIVDGDIDEASKHGTPDHKKHPGLKRKKGYIGFLGHGSKVSFRNIRIKEIK